MASYDARVRQRLSALIEKADRLLNTYKKPPSNVIGSEGWVDTDLFAEWRTQSLVLLQGLLGAEHQYAASFMSDTQKPAAPSSTKRGKGILKAALEDLNGGYLFDIRQLIAAEVFSDFLAMAQELTKNGYKDPAASLIGAVLEDGLRRIAQARAVDVTKRDGLDSLNNKLKAAAIYNAVVHSQVDAWCQIRNAADHGHFDDYTVDQVSAMMQGVTHLLASLLS